MGSNRGRNQDKKKTKILKLKAQSSVVDKLDINTKDFHLTLILFHQANNVLKDPKKLIKIMRENTPDKIYDYFFLLGILNFSNSMDGE